MALEMAFGIGDTCDWGRWGGLRRAGGSIGPAWERPWERSWPHELTTYLILRGSLTVPSLETVGDGTCFRIYD